MMIQSEAAFRSYEEAVDWITRRAPVYGIRPGLTRMNLLMEHFGHPERRLKFIHVAGTNGKGSVCAYLTEVLQRNGYDVGSFTSPYIERFTDRLRYNGKDIPDEDVLRLANRLKPLADELAEGEAGPPTMFELVTAMAILYFGQTVFPDFVVWETGLGGRLDSTNIVTPILSILTNVGHDHMDVLGDTLEKIAWEKAGIIKNGVPVVSAIDQPEALEVVHQVCTDKQATLYSLNREFHFEATASSETGQTFDFMGPFRHFAEVPMSMIGYHQFKNASVAFMALEVLRQYYAVVLEDEQIAEGFRETRWPGRLELVSNHPRLLLDGAHNPEGAAALAAALKETYRYRKLNIAMGMISTKDHVGFLSQILPLADTVIFTEPDFHKKMDAAALAERANSLPADLHKPKIIVEADWRKALDALIAMTDEEDLALVCGTLYLISDVRSWVLRRTDSEKGW